jgi:predicted outer membrane repeat protein
MKYPFKKTLMFIVIAFVLTLSGLGITPAYAGGGPFHVKTAGTGDCLSWANACTLQTALATAGVNNPVWVMTGTYRPTNGTDRSATFQLRSGVAVYGGFVGTETAIDQRDPLAHVTILSGDIGAAGSSDNSYHVVLGATGATLDGFTITGGNADGASPANRGGGMYNPDGNSPTLENLIFLENSAAYGGGLYNYYSSPTLKSITFIRNSATTYGGGLYNIGSSPVLTNVTFSGNTAAESGGGILNRDNSNPVLTNVTFNGNTAEGDGGGIANLSTSNPIIHNTIFWGNTAPVGAQISNANGSLPSVSDSIVEDGYASGTNIITTNPRLGTLDDYGGFTLTIPLLPGSSAIDALTNGTNGCGTTLLTDQRGVTRSQRSNCDIGAYEYDYTGTYYVKPSVSGAENCQSWANACMLRNALLTTVSGDTVWVMAGTHKPTTTVARGFTFQLVTGVAVYGGFRGTEANLSQRNPVANVTILSGNINALSEGSYHVVTGAGGATLDGFTITGGNANGAAPNDSGGGMYSYESNLNLANIIFNDNSAANEGGGLYNNDGNLTLTNVTFSGNSAHDGGGMYNQWDDSILTNVTFIGNTAANYGGGMRNYSSNSTLMNVTFSGNSAHNRGGGMYNWHGGSTLMNVTFSDNEAVTYSGGGMANDPSSPTLTNVTFSGNWANIYGGAMENRYSSNPTLTNVTFSGNWTDFRGGAMYNYSSNPIISNTIFWGNTAPNAAAQIFNDGSIPALSDSVVQGGCPTDSACANIITIDPMLGALGNYGGFTQTTPLLAGSSAIDTGNDAVCPLTDQRGVARPQGSHCDIGAYEIDIYGLFLPLVLR